MCGPHGTYELLPTVLPGGARVQGSKAAETEIERRLEKEGVGRAVIDQALTHFRAGGRVQLNQDVYASGTADVQVDLPPDEPLTPPEAFLGIAYLYVALGLENPVYNDALAEIRETLCGVAAWTTGRSWAVEPGRGDEPNEPAHMIGIDSVESLVVRIQLFRSAIYARVHLPAVASAAAKLDRVYLWMHVDTGEMTAHVED